MGVALYAVVGGLALGWISTWAAGEPGERNGAAIRHLWVVPVTLAVQVAWANWLSGLPGAPSPFRLLVPMSTAALLVMVLSNVGWPAARLVAVGIALNLTVIVANGNLMPISMPDAARAVSVARSGELSEGQAVPHTKDVVVAASRTRLGFLSDHLAIRLPYGDTRMLSPGDVLMMAGIAWWIALFSRRVLLHHEGSRWLRTSEPAGSSYFPVTTA